jgi:hypothetical protein
MTTKTKILLAGIWITLSEFFRNEIILKNFWIDHYGNLNLKFETLPINGILWTVWSFLLAIFIFKLSQKFSKFETIMITWLVSFLMMWITLYNLQVFPISILSIAIPLSIFEVYLSYVIVKRN